MKIGEEMEEKLCWFGLVQNNVYFADLTLHQVTIIIGTLCYNVGCSQIPALEATQSYSENLLS